MAGLAVAAMIPHDASAILITGSEEGNTAAPTEEAYVDSGWQYQGFFGSFLGTAISATQFITAKHIGDPAPGQYEEFTYNSISYSVSASYTDVPGTDLRIYEITSGTFSNWAEIYTGPLEPGLEFVTMGRSAMRGAEVVSSENGEPKGWRVSNTGGVMRWGTNHIYDVTMDGTYGELIMATFDLGVSDNEAAFSLGDSGGGVFVKDTDGVWKLAGINLGDTGYFATQADGSDAFRGAVYDMGGLYYQTSSGWQQITDTGINLPSTIFISSITGNLDFIGTVVPVPEPGGGALVAVVGLMMILRRRRSPPSFADRL